MLARGDVALRRPALAAVEAALAAADPYEATRALVRLDGRWLVVGDDRYDLDAAHRLLVLGAGKASLAIARALDEILDGRIDAGIVVAKYGDDGDLRQIRLRHAAHPVPDRAGLEAAEAIARAAAGTGSGDIVIAAITGGSSALLPLPAPGLDLADKQAVNRLLLASGADIFEINAVRKHLSAIKGGRLARLLHPGARLVNLTVSDVVGDALDYITDPTVPDTSTLADARATLDRYRLWERLPPRVARHLAEDGPAEETPKDLAPLSISSHVLVASTAAAEAARDTLSGAGFASRLHSTALIGDSATAGRDFARLAREATTSGQRPAAIVACGETTVRLEGEALGRGGPNQEFAIAAAAALPEDAAVLVLGLDTDGSDGPTELAGALADATSRARAADLGLDLQHHLDRHDATTLALALGDGIRTGATGTNVNDLKLLLVGVPTARR
ncbi:MAG: DUF4147 domain-containing protein [Alphaproteobacteria bacterium]|nr:DUF4147 domain-containing protein [Alphaproteobacteria bacterium]